jgi:hypothetical protein
MPWRFRWNGSIIPHIINSKLDGRDRSASWCSRFTTRKSPHLPILHVAKLLQNLSGSCGGEKKYVCSNYKINTDFSVIQLVNSSIMALVLGRMVFQTIHFIQNYLMRLLWWVNDSLNSKTIYKERKKDVNYSCVCQIFYGRRNSFFRTVNFPAGCSCNPYLVTKEDMKLDAHKIRSLF